MKMMMIMLIGDYNYVDDKDNDDHDYDHYDMLMKRTMMIMTMIVMIGDHKYYVDGNDMMSGGFSLLPMPHVWVHYIATTQ